MEATSVVIVGAGPAGLALALSLALHEVHSIILEKEQAVNEDPRGVFLAGDAVRILYQLGIGGKMREIGHRPETVNFHKNNFKSSPFFVLNINHDYLQQTVPHGILQVQPRLENNLRERIQNSPYCELRCSSEVISREELEDGVIVDYQDSQGTSNRIKCSWLVGADGKTGVVRKRFLEPTANIRQEVGLFKYTGTWVAANLKIKLPTPESHPEFPLWNEGFTPEMVYDLFWPAGWHFCSPPGKATASGRFGPVEDRFWRHEFSELDWDGSKNSVDLLWEHLLPMIIRSKDSDGHRFHAGDVTFPTDCIEIRRCRPFTFCQKVVNKWFYKRTVLIGDAAHVFPPFGGQGIACGVRDAHALAWRLALLLKIPKVTEGLADRILNAWSLERRQGVDDSARFTKLNGDMANEEETWAAFLFRKLITLGFKLSIIPSISKSTTAAERAGYKATPGGFFLAKYGGGGKLAQVYVRSRTQSPHLSDRLLIQKESVMTLLIVSESCDKAEEARVRTVLTASNVPPSVLSPDSLVSFSVDQNGAMAEVGGRSKGLDQNISCSHDELGPDEQEQILRGYHDISYINSLPRGTKYAILRPDFIIFSAAKSLDELKRCLDLLNERLHQ